jgi:hypothetical protein
VFLTANNYALSTIITSITLTIDISETPYYIKNVQSPIARQAEVIFHTLLFTILCLEISGLAFLIVKLLLIPLYEKISRKFCHKENAEDEPVHVVAHHHD